jgi:2,3-diketo-5-methylthio-1-phosphopentane phosphatase
MRVFCDFDGTITRQDSTDAVLEALAEPRWRVLQAEWEAGRLSGAACMRGQVELIGGSKAGLDAVLDAIELDPGFAAFLHWSEGRRMAVSVVSDGVDYFIARILARYGLHRLPVIANRLVRSPGAWRLEHPPTPVDCTNGSGVCKCSAAGGRTATDTMVFIGDGRSDFCISSRADILFAKGALAIHAETVSTPYLPFDTFHDITRALAVLVGEQPAMLGDAASALVSSELS